MPNYLYKLKFTSPVHFGADKPGIGLEKTSFSCHADTLFSAICQEVIALEGEDSLKTFIQDVKSGKFLISDLFPYYREKDKNEDELCLPKPALRFKRDNKHEKEITDRKKMKKVTHIPLCKWNEYLGFLKGETKTLPDCQIKITEEMINTRVAVSRSGEDGEPYQVGTHIFHQNTGLYFILKDEDNFVESRFDKIMRSLQYSGIGGKRSSGYGKFIFSKSHLIKDFAELLQSEKTDYYMSLSVISPKSEEIEKNDLGNSFYTLVPRKGFVASPDYSQNPLKRRSLVMFNAGSCFDFKFEGDIKDVSSNGDHPVYRYGKAMMMGVKI